MDRIIGMLSLTAILLILSGCQTTTGNQSNDYPASMPAASNLGDAPSGNAGMENANKMISY